MSYRFRDLTIRTSVYFGAESHRGIVTLFVHDGGKESVHRLPLPSSASSEARAQMMGVHEALQWARRLQRRRVTVLTGNEDVIRMVSRDIPVNDHIVGPCLQVRALLHAFEAAEVIFDPTSGMAAAV